jgi:3-phosphoshikimate 1-carboxyvinyltransferase
MRINGEIKPPADKSISHRAFILGALAKGRTSVFSSLESEDVKSTREALKALGVRISKSNDSYIIEGGNLTEPETLIDAGNSGTTARLLSGVLSGIKGVSIITGDSSLIKRPMARVIKPLRLMGADFMARQDRFMPMAIRGTDLKGITYDMDVASAQVKSAIILAGLKAEGVTSVTEPSLSRDHTERMLAFFGVRLKISGRNISLEGPQELTARDITVPGDPSSSAFPSVLAAATPGSELRVMGICLNPARTAFLNVLKRMGADITIENIKSSAGETVGDFIIKGSRLKGTVIEGDEIPGLIDEIPILAVAASLAEGRTIVRNAQELRVKEADRIASMVEGFASLGSHIKELEDGFVIDGPLKLRNGSVKTYSDHRIAMAFYILSMAADIDVQLDNNSCVDISYPNFFKDMKQLI